MEKKWLIVIGGVAAVVVVILVLANTLSDSGILNGGDDDDDDGIPATAQLSSDLNGNPEVTQEGVAMAEGTTEEWTFEITGSNLYYLSLSFMFGIDTLEGAPDEYSWDLIPPTDSGIQTFHGEAERTDGLQQIGAMEAYYVPFDDPTRSHDDFPINRTIRSLEERDAWRDQLREQYTTDNTIGTWKLQLTWTGDGALNLDTGDTVDVYVESYFYTIEVYLTTTSTPVE